MKATGHLKEGVGGCAPPQPWRKIHISTEECGIFDQFVWMAPNAAAFLFQLNCPRMSNILNWKVDVKPSLRRGGHCMSGVEMRCMRICQATWKHLEWRIFPRTCSLPRKLPMTFIEPGKTHSSTWVLCTYWIFLTSGTTLMTTARFADWHFRFLETLFFGSVLLWVLRWFGQFYQIIAEWLLSAKWFHTDLIVWYICKNSTFI